MNNYDTFSKKTSIVLLLLHYTYDSFHFMLLVAGSCIMKYNIEILILEWYFNPSIISNAEMEFG